SSGRIRAFVKNRTCPRPTIEKTKCTNCGTCVTLCPVTPKAVDWHSGNKSRIPSYKYERCIRCYCCQELCPTGAVSIKNTLLGKILFR
ncbi:MAG: 4Fe-4S binding protein, partial [Dehalococcoidales bacterium]|nr:4Fe-4S binding protein [Dehalococcoidales bacterium]